MLGDKVAGPLGRRFCGNGELSACRDTLLATLQQASGKTAEQVYPGDDSCKAATSGARTPSSTARWVA